MGVVCCEWWLRTLCFHGVLQELFWNICLSEENLEFLLAQTELCKVEYHTLCLVLSVSRLTPVEAFAFRACDFAATLHTLYNKR